MRPIWEQGTTWDRVINLKLKISLRVSADLIHPDPIDELTLARLFINRERMLNHDLAGRSEK